MIVAAFHGARFFVILYEAPRVPWSGHTNFLIPKRQGRRIQGGFRRNQLHVVESNPRDPRDRIAGSALWEGGPGNEDTLSAQAGH